MRVYIIVHIDGYEDFEVGSVYSTRKEAAGALMSDGWQFKQGRPDGDLYTQPHTYGKERLIVERKVREE